ncbi:MAG: hypothetical protein V1663_02795 [archaeon]
MNNKKKTGVLIFFALLYILCVSLTSVDAFTLNAQETSKNVCPGNTILFTATVNGDGFFEARLDGSASSWSTVVPNSFSLNQETKTLYIYVTPNSNVIAGNYNLNLIVNDELETKTKAFTVNVNSCHNVQITGQENKEMCSCNLDVYTYTLKNNGVYDESLDVSVDGSAKDFLTLSQNSILLHPNEQKTLYAYVDVPCENYGNYGFALKVQNNNIISSFNSNLKVNNCFDFDLNTDKDYVNFCEHSIENIEVSIKNLGEENNDFYATLDGPAWANIDSNKLNIQSMKEKSFNIVFNPDYGVQGTFDITLRVKSDYGEIEKIKNMVVDVRKCHDVILDILENKVKMCAGLENSYDVKIKNIGEFNKEFILEKSEDWVDLSKSSITLNKNEEKTFSLEIKPEISLEGIYNVYVKAVALDDSNIESEDKIEINIVSNQDCYMPEIKADDLDVNRDSSATLPIVIENKGNEPASYNIIVSGDGSSFSKVNPAYIKDLEPGKSEIVYLYSAPSLEINKGIYRLNIGVLKDETILKNKYININVKEAVEYTAEKKESFFQKIINWFNNLFKVPEQVIVFKEEKTVTENTKFKYKEEEHNLRILNVTNSSVTIVIESNPVIVLLDVGETRNIDITGDGVNDLTITLDKVENNLPYITVVEISQASDVVEETDETGDEFTSDEFEEDLVNISEYEEIEEIGDVDEELLNETPVTEPISEPVESQEGKTLLQQIWDYKNYILYGIIIVIVLIILFNIFSKSDEEEVDDEEKDEDEKESKDEEDEIKDEDEEEPLKVGRWIFGLIILAVIIYLVYRYNNIVFVYLSVYKYYILIGIIVLIILLLLVRYWDNIVDFFEEEVEEEEKVEKKVKKTVKKTVKKKR